MRNNLKKVLDQKGITRYQFANQMGVSWQTVNRWCNSKNIPPFNKMIAISDKLKVNINDLFEL